MNETAINMLKSMAWGAAKGALRTFVSVQGSHVNDGNASKTMYRYERLNELVEAFIKEVEDTALHE